MASAANDDDEVQFAGVAKGDEVRRQHLQYFFRARAEREQCLSLSDARVRRGADFT